LAGIGGVFFLLCVVSSVVVYRWFAVSALDDWEPKDPPVGEASAVTTKGAILDVVIGDPHGKGLSAGLYFVDPANGAVVHWPMNAPNRSWFGAGWAAKAQRLFWTADDDALMVTGLDGTTTRLRDGDYRGWGSPSASGDAIVHRREREGVTIESLAGTEPSLRLTVLTLSDNAVLAPSGDRIAFEVVHSESYGGVAVGELADGGSQVVLDHTMRVFEMEWTRAGDALALVVSKSGNYGSGELWVANANAQGTPYRIEIPMGELSGFERFLGGERRNGVVAATWSPDGKQLAVLADRAGPCWSGGQDLGSSGCFSSIYLVNRDGSGLRRLTTQHQAGGQLHWIR
jgi:hypothetical protein